MDTYDYIIVGAGSAGCVLANRLSANPDVRVLLLEAGGKDINPWIHVPVGYFKTMHNPKTDWRYKTQPDEGLNGRSLDWPRGKTLGGSSSINGLLYIRGQAEDYDDWASQGNQGWAWDDVLPYFKKSEDQERGSSEYHGAGGPLSVTNMRAQRDICDAFIEAAEELGIPRSDDFNGVRQEGAGYFQLTAKNGFRCSTAKGFLKPVKKRENLTIITHAMAEKLTFDQQQSNKVTGIRFQVKGRPQTAQLKQGGEVILSAGAIGSPQLLEVSGIGQGDRLQKLGIQVVKDLSGVGENLQDHLQLRLVYKVTTPTLNDEINNFWRRMGIGMQYVFNRSGPMAMGTSQVCIFARTQPETMTRPDIQYHIQPLSAEKPGIEMHPFSGITASVCQLRPESRGHIHINSPDANVYPDIVANYLSHEVDQQTAINAIKTTRQLVNTNALGPYIMDEYVPGNTSQSDAELLEGARNIAQTIYHPTSTCKMGHDDQAVVDHRLRVHGVECLRVVDASIMPTIVSGNTNAPTIMIAEKASDMLLQDRKAA